MKNRYLKRCLCGALLVAMSVGLCACRTVEVQQEVKQPPAYQAVLPTAVEQAAIFVTPIQGISSNFIKGMDISTVLAQEQRGVKHYNRAGNETDFFRVLADAGINYVKVQVWNHPFYETGKGFGGGNCDAQTAAEIGKRAAEYGMKLLVDFHYSDYGTNPNTQLAPQAWEGKTLAEKQQLLSAYTKESLQTILDAGAEIGMVQLGNEIHKGLAGEQEERSVCALLKTAAEAVHSVSKDIQVAVHYSEMDAEETLQHAESLQNYGVDYDVFGVSYHPFGLCSMKDMNRLLQNIKRKYNKQTCVLETCYPHTKAEEDNLEEDGLKESIAKEEVLETYPPSVQGQASCIRDVMEHASKAGALGVFYGGETKENQAMFDVEGHPLASLDVFKYVNYGTTSPKQVIAVKAPEIEMEVGDLLTLPLTLDAVYNDPSIEESVAVSWNQEQVAAVDTDVAGEYTIEGQTTSGNTVCAKIKIFSGNCLQNPSFEEPDVSMWVTSYEGDTNPTDIQTNPDESVTGDKAFHFYSESDFHFSVEQTVEGLSEGTYTLSTKMQGEGIGADAEIYLYALVDGQEYTSEKIVLDVLGNWKHTEITEIMIPEGGSIQVGMRVKGQANGMGTIDDWELKKEV